MRWNGLLNVVEGIKKISIDIALVIVFGLSLDGQKCFYRFLLHLLE